MKCDINIKRPSYGYQPENIKTGSSAIAAVDQTVKCHDLPACWVIGVCFERNERTDFDEVDATPAWHVLLIGTMQLIIIIVINSVYVAITKCETNETEPLNSSHKGTAWLILQFTVKVGVPYMGRYAVMG